MAGEIVSIFLTEAALAATGYCSGIVPTGYAGHGLINPNFKDANRAHVRLMLSPQGPQPVQIPSTNFPVLLDPMTGNRLRANSEMALKPGAPFQMTKESFNALPLSPIRNTIAGWMQLGAVGVWLATGTTGVVTMGATNVMSPTGIG